MKNIRKHYKSNKLRTIDPKSNDEFELLDDSSSVSDIQDYIEYIIKKHELLRKNFPIHVYINRINNRLAFKIKYGYKIELQTPEAMKLLDTTKTIIVKTKNWRKLTK